MSNTKNTGGSAFPDPAAGRKYVNYEGYEHGMTLRDYFAGQALTSVLDSSGDLHCYYDYVAGSKGDNNIPSPRAMAKYSYELADAMLAAREAQP